MRGLSFLPALSFPIPLTLPFRIPSGGFPFSIPLTFALTVPIIVVPENNIQITIKILEAVQWMCTVTLSKASPGIEMSWLSLKNAAGLEEK